MWDSLQPQDQRGNESLDWILDNDLLIVNDCSATQTSPITGNGSTPHISLCGSNWSVKTSWRLAEPIGKSDHLPIIIELNHKICYKPVIPRSGRWPRISVDWSSFTSEVESKMSNLPNEPNLSLRISRFNDILISAATTHVGKSKPSKRSKPWKTPHVRAKIRNRNRFRQMIHQNRQEWIDACHEANKAINETKTESWKNLLQDAMSSSDGPNMWKVIQDLNSTLDANSSNEAMSHNGRTITDIKSKANVFINHYARVSKVNMSQSERDTNQQFKKRIKVPSADDESCAPLLMSELQSAIKKMKGKGAAGPDNIPPSFLKSLGPLALQELLSIFNSSFSLAHCPRIWRVATIIPLLKAGKSPSEVASFCPISLTSCDVKRLERILADCIYFIAETNNIFCRFQAGFFKGWSCEDQITWIVQAIEDGFQKRLMQCSVLTLLDFSKA